MTSNPWGLDNPVVIGIRAGTVDPLEDPRAIGQGVINHGRLHWFGEEKTTHAPVFDVERGSSKIRLDFDDHNWRVGDQIFITGMKLGERKCNDGKCRGTDQNVDEWSQSERRKIIEIDGKEIRVDAPFQFDHKAITAMEGTDRAKVIRPRVGNLSRAITVQTIGGTTVDMNKRGHFMAGLSAVVDVEYAAFIALGRTDKARPAFRLDDINPDDRSLSDNLQGRYAVHTHHMMLLDEGRDRARFIGNAVRGCGLVHGSPRVTCGYEQECDSRRPRRRHDC